MTNGLAVTLIDMLEATLNSENTSDSMSNDEAKAVVAAVVAILKKEKGIS